MKRRFALYFLAANLIGGFFLWLALRDLPLGQIGPYLETTSWSHLGLWSLVFVVVYAVSHLARVWRWSYLVRPLGPVEVRKIHRASTVGFAAILLLPLRLGELVRPALLSRRSELTTSSLLATAVVERVIDGLLVTGLLFLTLFTNPNLRETGEALWIGVVAAAIFLPALSVCLLALWRRDWATGLIGWGAGLVSESLADSVVELLDSFIDGFRGLTHRGFLGRFMVLTLVYWGINILSMWMLAVWGFGFELTIWDMSTVIAILVIGIMIPAGPGLAGNFEAFLKWGFGLLAVGAAAEEVFVFAVLVHLLQFLVIVLPGIWVMWTDPAARHLLSLSSQAQERLEEQSS